MNHFKGFEVKVTYPDVNMDKIKGLFLENNHDHIVLKDEDEFIHYIKHDKIRGLTRSTKDIAAEDVSDIAYTDRYDFISLLEAYENNWVKITREGVKTIQGFISKVNSSSILFIMKDEISLIPLSQISYLSSNKVMEGKKGKSGREEKHCDTNKVRKDTTKFGKKEEKHTHSDNGKIDKKHSDKHKEEQKKADHCLSSFKMINKYENKHDGNHSTSKKKVVYRSSAARRKHRYR